MIEMKYHPPNIGTGSNILKKKDILSTYRHYSYNFHTDHFIRNYINSEKKHTNSEKKQSSKLEEILAKSS